MTEKSGYRVLPFLLCDFQRHQTTIPIRGGDICTMLDEQANNGFLAVLHRHNQGRAAPFHWGAGLKQEFHNFWVSI
jgi:hypothetical protein